MMERILAAAAVACLLTPGALRAEEQEGVELPEVEIQGEIERPDIFFLLPRARDRADEQVIRARLHREITRPLVKEWLEEELLLK